MRNEMELTFSTIVLKLPLAAEWEVAKRLTGKMKEISPGEFEMALSTHNLHRIGQYFPGSRAPVITKGHGFLKMIKDRLTRYKAYRAAVLDILKTERYPVEPNGLFIPYAHQTRIIGCIDVNPFCGIFTDCGTGKTGAEARAMELQIGRGNITPGKILVSAPLSILDTSWSDDVKRFTRLRTAKLWTPLSNKDILGADKVLLTDLGEKPADAVTVRTKDGRVWVHPVTREVRFKKPTALDGKDWIKYAATWKVSTCLMGIKTGFGPVYGRTHATDNTREKFIRDQLARTDVDLFLINHDGVRIYEEILTAHDFEWVVIDESTKIKNPKAAVAQAHVDISWKCKRRNVMTGTPNPNGFEDLWYQFYFLDRGLTLEPALLDYLMEYFEAVRLGFDVDTPRGPVAATKYVIKGAEARDRLIERVKSVAIFIDQRDCLDLPERTNMRRVTLMTEDQEKAYREMEHNLIATLKDEITNDMVESEAANSLAKIMRLRQITSGFLSNREGELVSLTHNPKYEDLDDAIEELGGKKFVLVCQFREEIRQLLDRYKKFRVTAIYGDVTNMNDRADSVRNFQTDPDVQGIIFHPAAAAHGNTLTAAHHLYFLSLSYNYEHWYQSAKRIERIGQKHRMFVYHCLAHFRDGSETIDDILYDVLLDKDHNRNLLYKKTLVDTACDIFNRMKKQVEERHE